MVSASLSSCSFGNSAVFTFEVVTPFSLHCLTLRESDLHQLFWLGMLKRSFIYILVAVLAPFWRVILKTVSYFNLAKAALHLFSLARCSEILSLWAFTPSYGILLTGCICQSSTKTCSYGMRYTYHNQEKVGRCWQEVVLVVPMGPLGKVCKRVVPRSSWADFLTGIYKAA